LHGTNHAAARIQVQKLTSMARASDIGTGTDSPARRVLAGQDDIRDWQEDVYRTLHQHPELSGQEDETAATAANALRAAGYEVHDGIGTTGVVGILRNGHGSCVLVRADMDALPMKEQTGLPYASCSTRSGAS
jgi:hippurate hydrolase